MITCGVLVQACLPNLDGVVIVIGAELCRLEGQGEL